MPLYARGLRFSLALFISSTAGVLVAAASATGQSPPRELSGRVVDAANDAPVPGASVGVRASAIGTVTSESGVFRLGVPLGPIIVTVHRPGFLPVVVEVSGDRTDVTIPVRRDPFHLDGAVVTGLATTMPAANAQHAAAAVSGDQMIAARAPTLEDELQGQIPGAVIQQDNGGAPGGGSQVQIRGVASINSDATPLYVIDGVILNNETVDSGLNSITASGPVPFAQNPEDNTPNRIADLNPEDVESIQVLRGPSASAIYGSKGAAGALLITTKRGTTSRPQWHLTGRMGSFLPANTLPLRTFPTYASANAWWQNDAEQHTDLPPSLYSGSQSFQNQLLGGGELSGEGDASVRGMYRQTSYYASILDKYDNGVLQHTGYSKQSARLNLAQTVIPSLSVSTNLFYQHSVSIRGVTGNDNEDITPYDVFATTPQFFDLSRQVTGNYVENPFALANPFADAALIQTPSTVARFIGGGTAAWKAYTSQTQTLQAIVVGGVDLTNQHDLDYAPASLEIQQFSQLPGIVNINHAKTTYFNVAASLVHHFVGVRGVDATTSIGAARDGRQVTNPDFVGIGLPGGTPTLAQARVEAEFQYRYQIWTQSIYAQEQVLALGDRLALTGGVTTDRNADNGASGRYYVYPHAGVSYRVPAFLSALDDFKVRAAYGRSGTAPSYGFNFNNAQNFYPTLAAERRGVVVGLNPNSDIASELDASHLRPEMSTEIEGGFDATLLGSMAQVSATVYQKRVTDLVILAGTSTSFGLNTSAINGGQFTNQGIELSLQAAPLRDAHGVTWLVATSFTRNYSRVDALPDGPFRIVPSFGRFYGTFRAQVGRSVSEIVNPSVLGADGTPVQVGDAQPGFVMTFANTITWRRLRLYGLLDWHRGGSVINLTNAYYDNGLFLLADSAASARRLAALAAGQTPYVESATFIKLRELTLSYEIPEQWLRLSRGRIHTARLSLSGRNLLASFRYTGLDPEVSDFGNTVVSRSQDVTPYPPVRSLFLSVDIGL